jgi:hypothetical protein
MVGFGPIYLGQRYYWINSLRPQRGWTNFISSGSHQTGRTRHRAPSTPVHELERYMRCKDCSQVRGYPSKRSHLVALRATKISATDPPSTWCPGER